MLKSKKIESFFFSPRHAYKLKVLTDSPDSRFLVGEDGSLQEGELIVFYVLVNTASAMIEKMSYQVLGSALLCAAAESLCDLVIGKNLLQASRIGADLLEKSLKDSSYDPPFDMKELTWLNKVLSAFYQALVGCEDLFSFLSNYSSPVGQLSDDKPLIDPQDWKQLTKEQKMGVIRSVIEQDIQPFVALDQGGVELKDLVEDREVILVYQGSCTSCYSAIGGTLDGIQRILRQKVYSELSVTPDKSVLKF